MTTAPPPLLAQNILAQPDALRAVRAHHFSNDREALVRAADLLRASKRIILTGMGASLFGCAPLSVFFAGRGVVAEVVETAELLHFATAPLDESTVVVVVSRSGESVEAVKLLPVLRQRRTKVIGVTNVPRSTVARGATVAVLLGSPADEFAAIQTYAATVATLLLLGAACFLDLYGGVKAEFDQAIEALAAWVPECMRWSGGWPSFFATSAPVYVLGRGASLAACSMGALLMHEVAKAPAVGMSAGQFRHGPVEAVNEQFRAVVLGTQSATREIDRALAEDLLRIGANVRWIGPAMEGSPVQALYAWPDVPERFAPLAEIVPLQIAAYRTAEWRGLPLGKARFAALVTDSETGFAAASQTA